MKSDRYFAALHASDAVPIRPERICADLSGAMPRDALVVVDTGAHWSTFGELVILGLIQIGGFGIMAVTSLLAMAFSGRFGLRTRMRAGTEVGLADLGGIRRVLRVIGGVTIVVEGSIAVVLSFTLWAAHGRSAGRAIYEGIFHSVSAFNNAGFSLYPNSLEGFVGSPVFSFSIAAAVIVGGLGFPVLADVRGRLRTPRKWSLHAKIVVSATIALLVFGVAVITAFEWGNPETLGPLHVGEKLTAGIMSGVMPRTAGFNSVDIGGMHPATLLITDALMFIGAGNASTGGGIKIATFAILGWAIWAELRGDPDVSVFHRRVDRTLILRALTVALIGVASVMVGTLAILGLSGADLESALFEATSAFATAGLSTGLTPALSEPARLVVIVLMFTGRVGPATLGTALVLRSRRRRYRFPEEGLLVG
ncbi:MAG: potassium transporter TrkG [Acidimicrobiales bacterium]